MRNLFLTEEEGADKAGFGDGRNVQDKRHAAKQRDRDEQKVRMLRDRASAIPRVLTPPVQEPALQWALRLSSLRR